MRAAVLLLLACIASSACARSLFAPTPTEALNAQRNQQQQAAAAAANNRAPVPRRLPPPCYVPSSYAPYQTCAVSTDAATCGRGFNAWPSYEQCCAKQRGAIGAFPTGCTNFSANLTCWTSNEYYPRQTCKQTDDFSVCSRSWGRFASEQACCAAGGAFQDGCSKPEPCYVATSWFPSRLCGLTEDQAVCLRGWGAYPTEDECCVPGEAHSEGCGAVLEADDAADA
ncbi:hypothetical protein D9Q98_005460 [Chlorella vulgaris]|uniref:Uncharacterized protein n=1 Tax=Chlorella vulgaris TaxID=3077 RepID=A0A9D4TM66_CHLVU|nr:hypothetical protein D9Q98_005460 [Chlorella vulgaris]